MTNKELQEKLKEFDDNLEVYFTNLNEFGEEDYPCIIDRVILKTDKENNKYIVLD